MANLLAYRILDNTYSEQLEESFGGRSRAEGITYRLAYRPTVISPKIAAVRGMMVNQSMEVTEEAVVVLEVLEVLEEVDR